MDDVIEGVEGESPAPTTGTEGQTTQAPQPPVDPDAGKPFHQHPRWIARENQWRTKETQYTQAIGQLNQRLQQLEARGSAPQGQLTQAEQQEYATAVAALERIFASNPRFKRLLDLSDRFPQIEQATTGVRNLTAAQSRAHLSQGQGHISNLVKEAGFNVSKEQMQHVVRMVAGAAMQLPNGNQRYDAGDFSVLDEAFAEVKGFIDGFQKGGNANVAQTKIKTRNLPPAPRGSTAGPEAPKPIEPGKERQFQASLHKKGLAMLRARLAEE